METVLLKEIQCKWCRQIFHICHSCWHCQVYCSDECRFLAKRQIHNKAQQRYRQTPKGKEAHRKAEKRRRMQQMQKTMDDASSTPGIAHDILLENRVFDTPCCRYCGRKGPIVDFFPRRGYGPRSINTDFVP